MRRLGFGTGACGGLLGCALALGVSTGAARAADASKITVQGVQASEPGKNTEDPEIDKSLAPFAKLLQKLGYGKYEDIGRGAGRVADDGPMVLKVGPYTVTITVGKRAAQGVAIHYLVKQGRSEIGKGNQVLRADKVAIIQVGPVKRPVFLLLRLH